MQKLQRLLKRITTAVTFTLALCLSSMCLAASPVLDRVVEQGVLRVAMSGAQQPFNFVYGKNEALIGFDVELAEALAGIMKVKLVIVRTPFDQLLAAIEDGKADMVISGMSITPDRTQKVSFVGPYMLSGKSLLTINQDISKVNANEVFNSPDKKLVALKGSTSESFVQRNLPKASLTVVADYDEGVKLLLARKVNGMVADMPILAVTKQRYRQSDLHILAPPLSTEPLGIAIARGDEQFENLVRNYLSTFKDTGLLVSLHKKWF